MYPVVIVGYILARCPGLPDHFTYLVACGLIDGRVDQASFTPGAITRADLLDLAREVTFENAEKGTTGFPVYFPGHLIVTTTDGRTIEKRVAINRGNPVGDKFQANVADVVTADQAQAILTALLELDKAEDCSALLDAVKGRGKV
ncbi:hypothetical protein DC366_14115 [Pelagivirga sediminicola]|uniref:MmgE/PrpD C-terminal domain-containing protein n=1 Tax=Pelagivirga sediminicola TaxID=2170575 RepID=A0A2T7G500_9RHOB|nr:hypothetical protein DC366_14115 [Pelagivirga sediminicola]